MAYMMDGLCAKCGNKFQYNGFGSIMNSITCGVCLQKEEQEKEDKYFAELDELTLEERVRKIEKWIYRYKPSKSVFDERF